MQIIQRAWFKWLIIGGSFAVLLGIAGSFFLSAYLDHLKKEKQKAAELKAEHEYEDKFRTAMMRIRQNLKLEHYLAAYKNLEFLPEPRRSDPFRMEEYLEVLHRIGNGLIQSHLLKESESVFLTIRNYEDQLSKANDALSRIESKRRIENAQLFLSQGEHLLSQKRYREAYGEFEKAQLEMRSVEILQFDDIKTLWERLLPQLSETRFHTFLLDAEDLIRDAEKRMDQKKFKETDQLLTQAAIKVGRAAFIQSQSPDVKKLREKIVEVDSELGYRLPNDVPIWNLYPREELGKNPHYFSLVGYELSAKRDEAGRVKIALQYLMHAEDPYFVVRYRIYFYNNRDLFNGHFILPEPELTVDQVRSVVYLQEIPDDWKSTQIKRIEVKIFDANEKIVSRLSRAFRKTSS